MERRRGRSKSATGRKAVATSPKPVGRPKSGKSDPKKRERSRTRSKPRARQASASRERESKDRPRGRSRSTSKTRTPARTSRETSRRKEEAAISELKLKTINVVLDKSRADSKSRLNDVIRRSLSKDITVEKSRGEETSIRRSSRFAAKEESLKKVSSWKEPKASSSKPEKRLEFGGWIGALAQIISTALIVGSVLLGCTKEQCLLKPFHIPRNWRVYLNAESALAVVGFFVIQSLLSLLPIGRVVRTGNTLSSYRSNGFLALFITIAGVAGAWHYGCPVSLAYERWIPLAVSSYIFAWILAIILYFKGGRAPVHSLNPYGNTGNRLYDFFVGREINPTLFGRINLKLVILRSCVIAVIILDGLLFLKGYEVRKELSPTLLLAVGLWALYSLDYLWFEEGFSSTFEAQSEGLGFMTVQGFFVYPFFRGIIPRFILTHRIELPIYALVGIGIAFIIGYFIFRASNLQKATFRKNPLDPTISHLETIPTNRGKKLLVSGWWGIVKHPNYLGDIIVHLAMTAPVGVTHAMPYIIPLFVTLLFAYRAKRDDNRCRERYGSAWTEYSRRVPYYIVPRIY